MTTDASTLAETAYQLAEKHGPSEKLESLISLDAEHSYWYAYRILRGRFPAGESVIATDPYYSCYYARDVLKGPFPEGEPSISISPWYSLVYAIEVLKGPFEAGEDAISAGGTPSYNYAVKALNRPFPLGEKSIAKMGDLSIVLDYQFRFNRELCSPSKKLSQFPLYALSYAIMSGVYFPAGEKTMKKSPRIWKRYCEFLDEID